MSFIGYIYLTTNLINNKIYIGRHSSVTFDKKYYGTGKLILRAINKNGKENFKVEILYWSKTLEDLNDNEIWFISHFNSTDKEIGYNIALGGYISPALGYKHTEEWKEMARKRMEGNRINIGRPSAKKGVPLSKETKEKLSLALKGRKVWNKGISPKPESIEKTRQKNLGRKLSIDTKEKMSISAKKVIHTLEWNNNVGKANKGKIKSVETRNRISLANKGHRESLQTEEYKKAQSIRITEWWRKRKLEQSSVKEGE